MHTASPTRDGPLLQLSLQETAITLKPLHFSNGLMFKQPLPTPFQKTTFLSFCLLDLSMVWPEFEGPRLQISAMPNKPTFAGKITHCF